MPPSRCFSPFLGSRRKVYHCLYGFESVIASRLLSYVSITFLLIMRRLTAQTADPRATLHTPYPSPIAAYLAELPLRFPRRRGGRTRSIVRKWRRRDQSLHDGLRRRRGDVGSQKRVIAVCYLRWTTWSCKCNPRGNRGRGGRGWFRRGGR